VCLTWVSATIVPPSHAAETRAPKDWAPDAFLSSWQVLGPLPVTSDGTPGDEDRKTAFARDFLSPIGGESNLASHALAPLTLSGTQFRWKTTQALENGMVDLGTALGLHDDVIAYAYAEFTVPATEAVTTRLPLGLGSDDGIRVWLNGQQIHENWIGRAARPDDDLVSAELRPGRNRLLIKVQNLQGPWGFYSRHLGPDSLGQQVHAATHRGDLDRLRHLTDIGANLNYRSSAGLTPALMARLRGHQEVVDYLAGKGIDVSAPLPDPATLAEARFSALFKPDGPGAAVLVARNGKVLFEKGYGLADVGNQVPVTPQTRFRIGSITKQFAAAAILKLQEDSQLHLTNSLAQYFPDYPRGEEVTLHQLLTHTSGIHSFTSQPGFVDRVTGQIQPDALIESFRKDPFDFNPGERFLYNNSGYFLLGVIIEKVSGTPWGDFLHQNWFDPLQMTHTGVHVASEILAHEAYGYSYEGDGFTKANNWNMAWAGAAGALYSTVGDLHRWNEAVFSHRVLQEKSLAAAFTPVKTKEESAANPEPKDSGYGYGWGVSRFRGQREISHGGGLQGFVSQLLRLPDAHFTAVVLVNCAPPPPGVNPGELAHDLAEFYLPDVLAPRTQPKVDPTVTGEALAALVGRYDYGSAFMEISRDGNRLFAQLTGQPKFEIFPRSSTHFFWKVVDAEITFIKDDQGQVTEARHLQGGQTIRAPKVNQAPTLDVPIEMLESYVGRYDYGGGQAILTVTREGTRLFAQLTGQPRFEIFPRSETEFHWKVVPAQVTFVKDSKGQVTHVIHEQAGTRFEAPRLTSP
jgi:CubicO group peptidase (beta-lactamase class C family)